MLKVGIAGVRGLSTLPGFRSLHEQVRVTALCDTNQEILEKVSKEQNIPHTFRVFNDMLESDIDIVVVSTPMQYHVDQCILALQAKKHVLCEVTAGVSLDELWWLIEAVEQSGMVYSMAENFIYLPAVQQVINMVSQGVFGETYFAEGGYVHNILHWLTYNYGLQSSRKPSWRRYWQMGMHGAFYPTHTLGPLMRMFPGEHITEISCRGTASFNRKDLRQEDCSITLCNVTNGKLLSMRTDTISPRPLTVLAYGLQGTKGCYEGSRQRFAHLTEEMGEPDRVWLEGMDELSEAKWRPLSDLEDQYMPERYKNRSLLQIEKGWRAGGDDFMVADFVDSIINKKPPPVSVYEACEWTSVGLLSAMSVVNKGKSMDVPRFRKNMPKEEQIINL